MSTEKSPKQTFQEFIREGRIASGQTQAEVARELGITQSAYAKIENGQRNVSLQEAAKICFVIGANLVVFLNAAQRDKHERRIDALARKMQRLSGSRIRMLEEVVEGLLALKEKENEMRLARVDSEIEGRGKEQPTKATPAKRKLDLGKP